MYQAFSSLDHRSQQVVDVLFTISPISALHKRMSLHIKASLWWIQLKRPMVFALVSRNGLHTKKAIPEQVVSFLEVWAAISNFMDQILYTDNPVFPEMLFNLLIVLNRNSGAIYFQVPALIDQFRNGLFARVSIGHIWFHQAQHLDRCLVQFYKGSVMQLSKSQQGQDFARLRMDRVDTLDPNHESDFCLRWHKIISCMLSLYFVFA